MCNMNKIKNIKNMTLCASSYHCMSFGNPLIFTRLSDYYTLILKIFNFPKADLLNSFIDVSNKS